MSRWIEWIKEYAKKTNKSYGCALSDPECSASYRRKYGVAKKVPAKTERERMGMEDKDAPAPPRPPSPPPAAAIVEEETIIPVKKSKKKKAAPAAAAAAVAENVSVFPRPELTSDEKNVAELYHQLDFLRDQPFPGQDMPSGPARDAALKKHNEPKVVIEKKLYNKYGIIPEDTDYNGLAIFRRNPQESIIRDLHKFGMAHTLDYIKDKYKTYLFRASGVAGRLPHTTMELKRIKNIIDVAEKFGSEAVGKSLEKFFNKKFGIHNWEGDTLTSPVRDKEGRIAPKWIKEMKTFAMRDGR